MIIVSRWLWFNLDETIKIHYQVLSEADGTVLTEISEVNETVLRFHSGFGNLRTANWRTGNM